MVVTTSMSIKTKRTSLMTNYYPKEINVYNDGKLSRGRKAKILTEKYKKFLIEFYDSGAEELLTVWFYKVSKERKGIYCHKETNTWFYKERETEKFKQEYKSYLGEEYYNFLFGENKGEKGKCLK